MCYYVLIRIKTPLFDVCVRLKGHYMDTLLDRIDAIKSIFEQQGQSWVEPYETTEGAINRKEVGDHRGLYYFIENN